MKTIILLSCLACLLITAGCATGPAKLWYKDSVNPEQFARDKMSCRQYGMQSAMANGLSNNMFVELWISREAETCMVDLGYTLR